MARFCVIMGIMEEKNKLVGYCPKCKKWFRFIYSQDKPICKKCGTRFSQKRGEQYQTERSFKDKIEA